MVQPNSWHLTVVVWYMPLPLIAHHSNGSHGCKEHMCRYSIGACWILSFSGYMNNVASGGALIAYIWHGCAMCWLKAVLLCLVHYYVPLLSCCTATLRIPWHYICCFSTIILLCHCHVVLTLSCSFSSVTLLCPYVATLPLSCCFAFALLLSWCLPLQCCFVLVMLFWQHLCIVLVQCYCFTIIPSYYFATVMLFWLRHAVFALWHCFAPMLLLCHCHVALLLLCFCLDVFLTKRC